MKSTWHCDSNLDAIVYDRITMASMASVLTVEDPVSGRRVRLMTSDTAGWQVRITTPISGGSIRLQRIPHHHPRDALDSFRRTLTEMGITDDTRALDLVRDCLSAFLHGRPGFRAHCLALRLRMNEVAERMASQRIALAHGLRAVTALALERGLHLADGADPSWLTRLIALVDSGASHEVLLENQLTLILQGLTI